MSQKSKFNQLERTYALSSILHNVYTPSFKIFGIIIGDQHEDTTSIYYIKISSIHRAASNFYEKFYETGFTEKTPENKLYRMTCLSIFIEQIFLQVQK